MSASKAGKQSPRAQTPPKRATAEQARLWAERLRLHAAFVPACIVLWTVSLQLLPLIGNPLARTPVDLFFHGDGWLFLEQGRRLAAGLAPLVEGLPLHPPLAAWLSVPLWWGLGDLPTVSLAAKLVSMLLSGLTFALLYRWLAPRLEYALPWALLLPLGFGELALAHGWSTEVPYRLLLVLLLGLGWRRPWLAGLLHGLAVLARPEHLALAGLAAGFALWRLPRQRRAVLTMAGCALLTLLPYGVSSARAIARYNQAHRAELPMPLPVWRSFTLAGPLNLALAAREEEIFFARRSLPMPPGQPDVLDPTFAPHNEALVHGTRLALEAIWETPGRFVERLGAKLAFSVRSLGLGWTWRDLPNPPSWVRQPVDLGLSTGALGWWLGSILALLGAWSLRREREILLVGGLLLASRLLTNLAFFPYLRSMAIAGPFLVLLVVAGLAWLARRQARPVLWALVLGLAVFHAATAAGPKPYRLDGERDEAGQLIDDRRLTIELVPR